MSVSNQTAKAVAIIGMTGTGKNFNFEKYFLLKMPDRIKFLADVNNNYGIPFKGIDEFMSHLIAEEEILVNKKKKIHKYVKVNDALIFIDEATIFFDSHKADDMDMLLVGKRHDNNFIVLLFHSLADFPKYIKRKVDYIFLLKTLDDLPSVIAKFGANSPVTINFKELEQIENIHELRIIKMI